MIRIFSRLAFLSGTARTATAAYRERKPKVAPKRLDPKEDVRMPRWLADRRDQQKVENMAVSHLFEMQICGSDQGPTRPEMGQHPLCSQAFAAPHFSRARDLRTSVV